MKCIPFTGLAACLFLLLNGCASNMTERGTWVGKGELVELYELDGKVVRALALHIDPSEIRKTHTVDSLPILVDNKLTLINSDSFIGKTLRVNGLIEPEYPINPIDHQKLYSNRLKDPLILDMKGVIKVKPRSIRFVTPPTTPIHSDLTHAP